MLTEEYTAESRKADVDDVIRLTGKLVESVVRLTELNMQVMRSALSETRNQVNKALSIREPQEWVALQDTMASSMAEKAQAYGDQLSGIVSTARTECVRFSLRRSARHARRVRSLISELARYSPAGWAGAVALLDPAIEAANSMATILKRAGEEAAEATVDTGLVSPSTAGSAKRAA
ncbi:phasin family protein [Paraburkholderia mimosarum]|uniref:phasin family protein n=1 Tax=Paraburkholderia mimosarum TaxID=312026 RepID=UPI000484B809|nr:phasin family protein [Paraburkholderia mimosarum]